MKTSLLYLSILSCISLPVLATAQTNQLSKISNDEFTDSQGFVDTFTCPSGGTPLVIYSTAANNQQPISSADTIIPAYIAPGFKPSELNIPNVQQTDKTSRKYLTIKTRNPAELFAQFDLMRFDNQPFDVKSVQFPVPYLKNEQQAVKRKFVSQAFVQVDNQAVMPAMTLPVRDHSFDLDYRLEVQSKVKHLKGYFASWSQASQWGAAAKQKFSNVPYLFSALPSKDDPNYYNGYGVWVCGQAE